MSTAKRSVRPLDRLRERVGNPLNWSNADKCLLVALAVIPFAVWHTAILYHVARDPETAPYYNHVFVERMVPLHAGWLVGWIVIALAALLLRRRRPNTRLLVIVLIQFYCIGNALISYTLGMYTSNYMGAAGLSGFAVGFILFELRQVLIGVASFLAVVYGTLVASQLHLIPYAPLFDEAPFSHGQLHGSWLMGLGQLTAIIETFGLVLISFVVMQWRRREEQLAVTSDQLVRANELISRYIAAQVAEQIQAGNFGAVDRHDRRKLTIFFSDIKGFTDCADRMEPEELSEVLNEYLQAMVEIAGRYGGTVDKFMGDAIMIFFGAPVTRQAADQALSAVRMAMEMQHRMCELREKWRCEGMEEPFETRIGINTGVASVGTFGAHGRMDYTAIGRQVNLAARLQVSCEPGGILISHPTWALVKDDIACAPKGEIQPKGFHLPVRIYEVIARFDLSTDVARALERA